MANPQVIVGSMYEHYKGHRYKVLALAIHKETHEELVIYQALYGEQKIWARPLTVFVENVTVDGQVKPRFNFLE